MELADLELRWRAAVELAGKVEPRDFGSLGRLRAALEVLASGDEDDQGLGGRARRALRTLDLVILRDLPFDEGMAAVRRGLSGGEASAPRQEAAGPAARPPASGADRSAGAVEGSLRGANDAGAAPVGLARGANDAGGAFAGAAPGQYLAVGLGDETYGLDVLAVREIIALIPITPVPGAPSCLLGVINLRGRVIPIVDLRRLFALPPVDAGPETCIVIAEVRGEPTGLVVDRVCEVVAVSADEIAPAPVFGSQADLPFVRGLARGGNRVTILLDVEGLFAAGGLLRPGDAAA
ncbi:MAG: purine-binding chemotaxis protein CheW [Candidatus Eisenbacteria bacterium]|uniref:Purine-binding chemotaxis protein CheW n=1 Tax=Eiseniibacteriota bacterium TaxID=2212470 RepID=A0A938BMU9_UNCEI|nr:purine-binding chemotaxis protein CheW [Candidatus Eisenbacteria bacterium]